MRSGGGTWLWRLRSCEWWWRSQNTKAGLKRVGKLRPSRVQELVEILFHFGGGNFEWSAFRGWCLLARCQGRRLGIGGIGGGGGVNAGGGPGGDAIGQGLGVGGDADVGSGVGVGEENNVGRAVNCRRTSENIRVAWSGFRKWKSKAQGRVGRRSRCLMILLGIWWRL